MRMNLNGALDLYQMPACLRLFFLALHSLTEFDSGNKRDMFAVILSIASQL